MYRVKIYTGDYIDRQRAANADGAALYLEQHLNSSVSESPDYGLGVIAAKTLPGGTQRRLDASSTSEAQPITTSAIPLASGAGGEAMAT